MGWESSDVVRFDLGPLFRVKQGQPNLKVLINNLFLILEVFNVKPTYKKSWAGNLQRWSHLALALVSCLFGGYKFASVLRCVGLVYLLIQ